MTATAKRYASPYVSQILAESGSWSDCGASTGIMLFADWTLGEWLVQPEGDRWPVLRLREVVRKRIGDTAGGLTLHDLSDIGHELDPDLPDLPRYSGQTAKPGQSTAGATLRLDRGELRALLMDGHSAGICGLTANGVGHIIHITDGTDKGVLVKDPLTRHRVGWKGERWSWEKVWAFTEAKKDGSRAFGSDAAIAVAVVRVGEQTAAARAGRKADKVERALIERVAALRDRVTLTEGERDAARAATRLAEATAAEMRGERDTARKAFDAEKQLTSDLMDDNERIAADLAACRSQTPDCTAQVAAARTAVLDAVAAAVEGLR